MKKLLNKGFTIVELVIVIAVIGILAAVLIPTFSNVIESANETADLQEAQSTLKAYTAYMTSKGTPLSDGAVFKIEETKRTYVFYKGELHKVNPLDTKLLETPIVKIGDTEYACNKLFYGFLENDINDNGKIDENECLKNVIDENTTEYITFFYSEIKNVQFDDGSLKCLIYPGLVVKTTTKITEDSYSSDLAADTSWVNNVEKQKQAAFETFVLEGEDKVVDKGKKVTLTAKLNTKLTTDVKFTIAEGTTHTINGSEFTAGDATGDVTVTVTSLIDPTVTDTFTVKVK